MAENTTGRHLLTEKDFAQVVDADGKDLPPVPKHWGADQLPAGAEKKAKAKSSGSTSTSGSAQEPANPDTVAAIVKDVGDDKAKAQAALEAEQAKGDEARSSLVEKLQAIVDKA